jgi:hypothetical protein
MSVRTPNRGSLPTSRKRAISRAVVPAVCSAAVLLLCWSILKPGADTSLQGSAIASQQSRVVRFRLEVANPSCLTVCMQCSPSSNFGALQSFKRSLRQWDRHGKDYLGMCLFIKVRHCWLMAAKLCIATFTACTCFQLLRSCLQNQHGDVREWVAHHLAIGAAVHAQTKSTQEIGRHGSPRYMRCRACCCCTLLQVAGRHGIHARVLGRSGTVTPRPLMCRLF